MPGSEPHTVAVFRPGTILTSRCILICGACPAGVLAIRLRRAFASSLPRENGALLPRVNLHAEVARHGDDFENSRGPHADGPLNGSFTGCGVPCRIRLRNAEQKNGLPSDVAPLEIGRAAQSYVDDLQIETLWRQARRRVGRLRGSSCRSFPPAEALTDHESGIHCEGNALKTGRAHPTIRLGETFPSASAHPRHRIRCR